MSLGGVLQVEHRHCTVFLTLTGWQSVHEDARIEQSIALLLQLVPHYAEGVIYPLDTDEAKERTGVDVHKGDLGDELVAMMKGLDVSTIDFLRIQFKDEWDNFVERMLGKYEEEHHLAAAMMEKKISKEDISERHFLKSTGSIFSSIPSARMDLMIWASERGQMLSRWVAQCLLIQLLVLT
jgi:hypothetical protein